MHLRERFEEIKDIMRNSLVQLHAVQKRDFRGALISQKLTGMTDHKGDYFEEM